jgi:hypothetical protein
MDAPSVLGADIEVIAAERRLMLKGCKCIKAEDLILQEAQMPVGEAPCY